MAIDLMNGGGLTGNMQFPPQPMSQRDMQGMAAAPQGAQDPGNYQVNNDIDQNDELQTPDHQGVLDDMLAKTNIADGLEDKVLADIAQKAIRGYTVDLDSRKQWEKRSEEWMKLATQYMEKKTWPWPNAANVKFPLLTTAAMQFSARAYPNLVPSEHVVTGQVIGEDPTGQKQAKAERIGLHMSYQLLHQMPDWEEDMDKLCLILPIVGVAFKKTYFDSINKRNCSELVLAKDLVVNYWAKNLEECERVTHVLEMTQNQVKSRQIAGIFRDVSLAEVTMPPSSSRDTTNLINGVTEPTLDETTPRLILEQHTLIDLDNDGYKEPYVVTVDYASQQVLRIVARFLYSNIQFGDDHKIVSIKPTNYFTKFGFIPNPDGSFYDLGFGLLLGGINETANTLINQLIDAGTLSNMQAGFLSKGIRIRNGNKSFTPGEWKVVDSTGDDLKKGIVPLPVNQPSNVLLELLSTLVTSGKELSSIAEIFTGKLPGQNTPATTTMAAVEQGQKVFIAIYKRIIRSLDKEFKKLFRLNSVYLDNREYFTILDPEGVPQGVSIAKQDYNVKTYDVCPSADPNVVSDAQKLTKAQALLELLQTQQLDPKEVVIRVLQAQGQDDIQKLLAQGPPPPDPAMLKIKADAAKAQQSDQTKEHIAQMQAQAAMAGHAVNHAANQAAGETAMLQQMMELLKVIQSEIQSQREATANANQGSQ